MSIVLWLALVVIGFLHTLRLLQTEGRTERTGLILLVLALGLVLAAVALAGWGHAALMVLGWFGLPFVFRPLAAKVWDRYPEAKKSPRDAEADQRLSRLNNGEISLDEYFKDGDRATREWKERLAKLARLPEIAAVLKRQGVSFRQFCVLREQLVLIPELEWKILGSARFVAELIDLSASGKTAQDIARIFRAREKRTSG
jgi:hypothetical protein